LTFLLLKGLLDPKDIYMNTAIMTIGDELLIGQVIDTNSAWMAKALNAKGFDLNEIVSVRDQKDQIKQSLARLLTTNAVVLITGGLGPTKDDITKKTLAEYFQCDLVENADIMAHLEKYYAERNRPISESAREISLVPEVCEVFINQKGTAASMWFEKDNKVIVSMPGVPYEMKDMMTRKVIPRLTETFDTEFIYHRTILTAGVPESRLAEKVAQIEIELPTGISLAYLPSFGKVRMRLSGRGNERIKDQVDDIAGKIKEIVAPYVFGEGDTELLESPNHQYSRFIEILQWQFGYLLLRNEIRLSGSCPEYAKQQRGRK